MVIFLIWLGIVCCGVANGLIYDYIEAPQSYYYMAAIGVLNVFPLVYHRVYTRDWRKPKKKVKKNERRQEHFQVFTLSALFSIGAFASSLLSAQTGETSWGLFVGCTMVMVSFFIATARESYYI